MAMFSKSRSKLHAVVAALSLAMASSASAYDWGDGFNLSKKEGDQYDFLVSPYAQHFHPSPEHRHVWLVGVERERADQSLAGAAFFSNSFGQPSTYIFPWGKVYRDVFERPDRKSVV